MLFSVGRKLACSIVGMRRKTEKKETNSMSAKLTTRENGDVTIVDISGKLTMGEGSGDLREKIWELVEAGSKRVLLNMACVSRIDSSGIGELAVGYTNVTSAGGKMKLLNLDNHLQEVLRITQLCEVFETYEDEDSAIRSFSVAQPSHLQVLQPSKPGSEFYHGPFS
jgi:anti-sigma B factor antagonist